jgi:hypothetical protein
MPGFVTRLSINAFYFAAPEFQITGKGEIHIYLPFLSHKEQIYYKFLSKWKQRQETDIDMYHKE